MHSFDHSCPGAKPPPEHLIKCGSSVSVLIEKHFISRLRRRLDPGVRGTDGVTTYGSPGWQGSPTPGGPGGKHPRGGRDPQLPGDREGRDPRGGRDPQPPGDRGSRDPYVGAGISNPRGAGVAGILNPGVRPPAQTTDEVFSNLPRNAASAPSHFRALDPHGKAGVLRRG